MSGANSWLRQQRKSDLVELAETVGLETTSGLKKIDLEIQLDEFLAENSNRFANDPDIAPYYQVRARTIGSPVKKEGPMAEALKVSRRRAAKAAEQVIAAVDGEESSAPSSAVVATPGRALSQAASRVPLPATPADLVRVVDERTLAVRERVTSIYVDSGIREGTQATREALSTVKSVLFSIAIFELYHLRPELIPDRYAFTIPAVSLLGTSDHSVFLPDMFQLLTVSFWSPAILWAFTSVIIPSFFGYFFNLSAAHSPTARGKPATRSTQPETVVDPLTFSIAKAVISYVIYQQGATFGGLIDQVSVARINSAVYGGWKGVLTGTGITGLLSVYDAVLKK